jgi:hypothetical protein
MPRNELDEKRAAARTEVAVAARKGEQPREYYSAEDLAWAFRGFEDELGELEKVAAKVLAARPRRHLEKQVIDRAMRIESEWAAQEKSERRERAIAEARRQLGIDE